MQDRFGLTPTTRVLQKTPFGFDVSVWEFFWPLIAGARLVMAPPAGTRIRRGSPGLIERERVTTLHFVPSMLQAFLAHAGERCDSPRCAVVCSGEALPPRWRSASAAGACPVELHNLYGPDRGAIDVTLVGLPQDDGRPTRPDRRPVANTDAVRARRRQLRRCAGRVPGELYLGGVGLARGYLGRPG
jgi:non-ribosomal peptide synthetase component F